jgi:hypothetical protein
MVHRFLVAQFAGPGNRTRWGFMYYNFGRIHKSLRVTPAMEAGIADHVWSLEEIAGLID